MKEYIEREAFLEQKRKQYCKDCARRKGMRNGKYKTLYEIGEAPCRACEIDDLLNDVEDFPAADVRPVVLGRDICNTVDGHCEFKCSVCGVELSSIYGGNNDFGLDGGYFNFCPNCGADMRET